MDVETVLDWLKVQGLQENIKTFIPIYKRVLEDSIQALSKEEDEVQQEINKLFSAQVRIVNDRRELVRNLSVWSTDNEARVEVDGAFVLSKESLKILRAFSSINQSIRFQKGHVQSIINDTCQIYAQATLPESFPMQCFIYDMDELLELCRTMRPDDIEFYSSFLVVCAGDARARLPYVEPKHVQYPKGVLQEKNLIPLFTATISKETVAQLKKYGKYEFYTWTRDGSAYVSSYRFYQAIGETSNEFSIRTRLVMSQLMPGSYELTVFEAENENCLVKLKNLDVCITYFATPEEKKGDRDDRWFLLLMDDEGHV